MIRLRDRSGRLPSWVQRANQFALAFLLIAAGRSFLPTFCISLNDALISHACCVKPSHHLPVSEQAHEAEGLHAVRSDGTVADLSVPCAFCNLLRSLVLPSRYVSLPAPSLPKLAALPAPCICAKTGQVDRANPLRAPPPTFAA